MENKVEAIALLPSVTSMIDRLGKKNVIHSNKASNIISGLQLLVNKM
jgi:small subunit ribosomal protein S20